MFFCVLYSHKTATQIQKLQRKRYLLLTIKLFAVNTESVTKRAETGSCSKSCKKLG